MIVLLLWTKIICLNLILLSTTGSFVAIFVGSAELEVVAFAIQLLLVWLIMGKPQFWKKHSLEATQDLQHRTLAFSYN